VRAVNLIPAEQRRGAGGIAGRSGGIVYVVTGGLAVLVILGVVYALAVHGVADKKAQLATLTEQVTETQAQAQVLQPYIAVASLSNQKTNEVVTLAKSRFDWPNAMRQLALALPSDVTFTSFSAATTDASTAAPGSTPSATGNGGTTFSLQGCAATQREIANVLTSLASVPDVTNVSLTKTTENKRVTGKVSATSVEASQSACPDVAFQLSLAYSGAYTIGNSAKPSQAETLSAPTGSTPVTSTTQQTTGVSQ
jgi:Tfp pilus assembly protein PilN